MSDQVIPFFQRVEFLTREYWQAFSRDLALHVGNSNIDRKHQVELFEAFDTVDMVRCFLGMRAEWSEHELNPGLDEFSDIIFYTARVANYFGINCYKPKALHMSRAACYLYGMDQPIRNCLRPSPLKDKHRKILMTNLNNFIGVLFAEMQFKGYTEDMIINQLVTKLAPRYNK